MQTKDFYFDLPEELIAQEPSDKRGNDRLLFLDKITGENKDCTIQDFPSLLDENTVLIVNNSKVRKARTFAKTEHGGTVEFLFLEENEDNTWNAMVTKSKKQRVGNTYSFFDKDENLIAKAIIIEEIENNIRRVEFIDKIDESFFSKVGHVPLPPYIKREDKLSDETRYQTVYAKTEGSVASPTAGLHFTKEIIDEIKAKGIEIFEVTLHVGPGTFLPVRSDDIKNHNMHYEKWEIDEKTAAGLNRAKKEGKRVVCVGTTSIRTIESATDENGVIHSGSKKTNIFIYPGYKFKFVDSLFTNFHTPESTLVMLVSALAGKDNIFNAYKHAIEEKYRFFSYGDAMFIK